MWERNIIKMVVMRQSEYFLFLHQEILNVGALCFYLHSYTSDPWPTCRQQEITAE